MKGERIAEGRTAEVFAWGPDAAQVLKLFRQDCLRENVAYEYRIAQAVYAAGIAAPQAESLVEVDGRYGIVYARVQGPTLLSVILQQPTQEAALAFGRQLAEIHFALHQKHTHQLEPQRTRMHYLVRRGTTLGEAEKEAVLRALAALPDDDAVCHGDFHPDNVVLTSDGPRVIDWTNAVSGNPVADVCWTLLVLELGGLPPEDTAAGQAMRHLRRHFRDAYLARYAEHVPGLPAQVQVWLPIVAACRLSDEIADEQAALLGIVRGGLKMADF